MKITTGSFARSAFLPAAGMLTILAGCFLESSGSLSFLGPNPKDTTIAVGGSVRFRVTALCGEPCPAFQYEWKKNGVVLENILTTSGSVIGGATTGDLEITNAQFADSGTYVVTVEDSLFRDSVHLSVTPAAP